MRTLAAFLRDERGATAIEYAMMAALISIAIVAAVTSIGTKMQAKWESVDAAIP